MKEKPPLKVGRRYRFASKVSRPFAGTVSALFSGTWTWEKGLYQRNPTPLLFWTNDVRFAAIEERDSPFALSQMHGWEEEGG